MGAKKYIPIGSKINVYKPQTSGLPVPKAANDNYQAANDNGITEIPKKYRKAAVKGNLAKIANAVQAGKLTPAQASTLLGMAPASALVAVGATLVGGYVQGAVLEAVGLTPGFYAPGFTLTKQCPLNMSVPPGNFVQAFHQTAYSPNFGACRTGQTGAGMVALATAIGATIKTFCVGPEQIRPGLSTRYNHWQTYSRPIAGPAVSPTVYLPGPRSFPVPTGSPTAPMINPNLPGALVPAMPPVPDMIPPDAPAVDPVMKAEIGGAPEPVPRWFARPKPSMTRSQPPKKGEKEKKTRGPVQFGHMLAKAMDTISEGAEVVDAVYKALPPKLRGAIEADPAHSDKRGWADQFGQYGISGADWKLKAIYDNFDQLDAVEAFKNIIVNEAEDRVYGAAFRERKQVLAAGNSRYRKRSWSN